ncbi:TonB-dependent siderophore receptor [Bordetella bronchiseptica MBORD678]|uniref:TonB-dependent siderophore receptor n=2 Tax=Bordetella bronchiseptica TaxID=518 RepID=A0ABR4RBL9_BORBO|nr:TonB-dependent siderophore receptor [Bordetella bronchiseptica 00-P-2796]KDB77259.1 TonB-dependent siderophore receptor [Bordetella bronchiseptica CARE970018BB]KDB96915.1 TonB-dependent siderophore receptor [Bordetella bronchiseptica D993]KDC01289.1 TonB-dependent siderophore receptor [Bordetella bronchiseptica E010]KDC04664.1 TonB-dependent siderophore receptor [Bordetella bronchiseptica E012]KDC10471.1 TonB-dependent siderophore receptor [Bordetella bronchiseptica E013]KDC80408.1 TonB-de
MIMKQTSLYYAALGLAGLALAAPARAQEQQVPAQLETVVVHGAPEANGPLDLDAVDSTGSRLGLTLRETPASVTVINREQIEARGALDTQEIARGIVGVDNASPPGSAGSVSYRGFSGSQVSQLFNGISVQYDVIAARPIDSWIYDRVEAIGGPSSFLFGAGAVGGAINYVTKVAQRDTFYDGQLRLGSYGARQASVGLNRQLAGEPGGRGQYLRIDANANASDGWVDGNRSHAEQVAASLLSDLGERVTHTLALEYQHETVHRPYWGTPLTTDGDGVVRGEGHIRGGTRFKNYNVDDGQYEQSVWWLRSLTEWQASDRLSFRNTLYYYRADRDFQNLETYRYNLGNSQVLRSGALLQRHEQRLVGNRIEALYHGSLGGLRSDWSFGADYSVNRQTRYPTSVAGQVDSVDPYEFDPGEFYDIPGMRRGHVPDRDNKVRTLAFMLENRTEVGGGVALVTALRHDIIDLDLTNRRAASAASPGHASRRYNPTTGRVAVNWEVSPGATLYAQYATAADPPSGVLSTATFADVLNNDKLTTGTQVEAGGKFAFWDGRGTATVAVYEIKRKNLATPDPLNPGSSLPVGSQSARGLELAGGLQLTRALSLQANLALVDPRYDDFSQNVGGVAVSRNGKVPVNTPRRLANVWLDYAFAPDWRASLAARHVGKTYADAANTVWAPAYTVFDAALSHRIDRHFSVTARVRNLTDKVYAASVTGAPMYYLGAPRSVELALQARF